MSWRKQNALAATDRDFAKTAYIPEKGVNKTSGTTFPANYTQSGLSGTYNPSLPNCDPPYSIPGTRMPLRLRAVHQHHPGAGAASLIAKGSYAVNKDNTISLEYIQANNSVASIISPTPVTNLTVVPGNPFYPGNGITPANPNAAFDPTKNVTAGWRQTEVGGRASSSRATRTESCWPWEGQYKGWDYSAHVFQSEAKVKNEFTGGYVNSTMIKNGLQGLSGRPG